VAVVVAWVTGTTTLDIAWAPTWDLRLALELDGLAFAYALLATGVGLVVVAYSLSYVPRHLQETGAPQSRQTRLYGWLLIFMASMVGLAVAQDLVLLFVFWDLTAIASYFLVAFDREDPDARRAALAAMLVTGISAVLLLAGAVMLWVRHDTFSLPELFELTAGGGTYVTVATALIVVSALAKCAQVPFHFWLPRAMIAPTPVSAYLHSAAMVAAGVFLIGRVYPLIEASRLLLDVLLAVGFASIIVGGLLALTRDNLKQVLAYSTVSQYGYVVVIYGTGSKYAPAAAALYVVGHALEKCALFLTAGAVTDATGRSRLSELGGLVRRMPLLAAAGGVAAAGVAGLPLTLGFFQDELLFKAATERGTLIAVAAVVGAGLTVSYMVRFWAGIFLGQPGDDTDTATGRAAPALVAPVALLGGLVLAGGLVVSPFASLADEAAFDTLAGAAAGEPAYHLDTRAENLMALAAFALGATLIAGRRIWGALPHAVARVGDAVGPGLLYARGLALLNKLSDRLHYFEVRDLRTRAASVLGPAGLLSAAALVAAPGSYDVGQLVSDDIELLLALIVVSASGLALTVLRTHVPLVLLLSALGYALALVYAFFGAPDVALVAVLVETVLALVVFGVLSLIPREVLKEEAEAEGPASRRWRDPLVAVLAGLFAFLVTWGALSRPGGSEPLGGELYELAPEAHADDAVTVILADFRGLDTLGEITVVIVAMAGVARAVLRRRIA
jgi:multicomponent Na+:H+ antiporter subunit A